MLTKRKDGRYMKTKTINGKKISFYSSEPTERKAERDILTQIFNYNEKEEKGKLLSEVVDEWEEMKEKQIRYQTWYRYRSLIARFVNFYDSNKYIKELTIQDVEMLLGDMAFQQFTTKTIKDEFSIIKMIIRFAYKKGYISNDISNYISLPQGKPSTKRNALSESDIAKIKATKDSPLFNRMALFLLYTGLRKGELLALTYGDIDYNNNIISVNKELEYHGNIPVVAPPKTSNAVRSVPLPKIVKDIIPVGKHKKTDIIFPQNDKYMTKSYFRRQWTYMCKELGISFTAHQLRHTYCSMLVRWNVNEKLAQSIMGHADISTTYNIYAHIFKSNLNEVTKHIDNSLTTF